MAKDFRKKVFGKSIRGYTPEEVDEYLGYVTDEYRKLELRAADSERKLALALKKLDDQMKAAETDKENAAAEQKKIDEAYMNAVHEAQAVIAEAETTALNICEAAALEAEKKLAEAEDAARSIVETAADELKKARAKADTLYDAASEMYEEVSSFKDSLFALYNTHLESVVSIEASAKRYIDGADAVYSKATGAEVSHDDEDIDEETEEEIFEEIADEEDGSDETAFEAADDAPAPAKNDIFIDIADELGEEDEKYNDDGAEYEEYEKYEKYDEEADAYTPEEDESDMAVTRVLRLSALSEAIAASEEEEDFDESDIEDFAENAEREIADSFDESEYFEDEDCGDEDAVKPEDFEQLKSTIREIDSLFTKEGSRDLSLTDEFDIVFASSDSKKNVEEIRRQPMVAPEKPKNKKHKKY